MYSEKTFKNYIFWVQVKRLVVIIILSCIGAGLGILTVKILESTVKLTSFHNEIIAGTTIVFFLLSLLMTTGIGREVQDGYWKIAVLRKLTVIQKNLELNNELLKNTKTFEKSKMTPISANVEIKEEEIKVEEDKKVKKNKKTFLSHKKFPKKKLSKKVKKVEKAS